MSDEWKYALSHSVNPDSTSDVRCYLDPRGIEFAPISGNSNYNSITSADPAPGEYGMSQSTCVIPFPFSYPITFECYVKPTWAYNIGADVEFCKFYSDTYDQAKIALCYYSGTDQLGVKVYQNVASAGGGAITSVDTKLTKVYASDASLQKWIRLTVVLTSTAISIYANGNGYTTSAVTMGSIYKLTMFTPSNNVSATISYVLIYPGLTATAAQICSYYNNVKNESIMFDFQNNTIGRTRCDVSEYLQSYSVQGIDGYNAATASATFKTIGGELVDDQYAAFAPESGSYNGLVTQKYLTQTMGLTISHKARQKAQIVNDGSRRGYWSFDQTLPAYPDGAYDYFNDTFATTDSWSGTNCTLSVSGGALLATVNPTKSSGTVYRALASATKTYKLRILNNAAITSVQWFNGTAYEDFNDSYNDGTYTIYTAYATTAHAANTYFVFFAPEGTVCTFDWIYIGSGLYTSLLSDNSHMGGTGTIYGCTPVDGREGNGNAIAFDGTNDYVSTQDIRHATALTYAAWIYVKAWPAAGSYRMLLSRNGAAWYLGLYESGGVYRLRHSWLDSAGNQALNTVAITGLISLNSWARVVCTHDGTYSRIYINGTLAGTSASSSMQAEGSQSTAAYLLGCYNTTQYFFKGYEDEVLIDARAWSASEAWNDYAYFTSRGFALTTDASEEQSFYGTIDRGAFLRTSSHDSISTFSAEADDLIKRIARKKMRSSRKWADYYLARLTPASNSLYHEYAQLAVDKEVYNYLGNSGFENATISNSWSTGGVAPSLARSNTVSLMGTYAGYLTGTSGLYIYQVVTMEISKGNKLTFQVYVYSTASQAITLRLREYAGAVAGSYTDNSFTHAGAGWELGYVTHTVADSSSDRLYCLAYIGGTAARFDMSMLTFGGVKYYYVANTADGTSGVIDEASAVRGAYRLLGHITEDVDYQHDWAVINRGESPWEKLKGIADACLARYMHITQAGVLVMKSYFESADETTSRGDLPYVYSLQKINQPIVANRITVEGVYIDVRSYPQIVWTADGSSVGNESTDGSVFAVSLTDDEYYPDDTILPGGIECLYEDRKPGT